MYRQIAKISSSSLALKSLVLPFCECTDTRTCHSAHQNLLGHPVAFVPWRSAHAPVHTTRGNHKVGSPNLVGGRNTGQCWAPVVQAKRNRKITAQDKHDTLCRGSLHSGRECTEGVAQKALRIWLITKRGSFTQQFHQPFFSQRI
jgi:hypothetical protein